MFQFIYKKKKPINQWDYANESHEITYLYQCTSSSTQLTCPRVSQKKELMRFRHCSIEMKLHVNGIGADI